MASDYTGETIRVDEEHHYEVDIYECPICGKATEKRYRVRGPRPEDPRELYHRITNTTCANYHFV